MVDYANRTLRGAITNETPAAAPLRLPQGVLGPKVLLIDGGAVTAPDNAVFDPGSR